MQEENIIYELRNNIEDTLYISDTLDDCFSMLLTFTNTYISALLKHNIKKIYSDEVLYHIYKRKIRGSIIDRVYTFDIKTLNLFNFNNDIINFNNLFINKLKSQLKKNISENLSIDSTKVNLNISFNSCSSV